MPYVYACRKCKGTYPYYPKICNRTISSWSGGPHGPGSSLCNSHDFDRILDDTSDDEEQITSSRVPPSLPQITKKHLHCERCNLNSSNFYPTFSRVSTCNCSSPNNLRHLYDEYPNKRCGFCVDSICSSPSQTQLFSLALGHPLPSSDPDFSQSPLSSQPCSPISPLPKVSPRYSVPRIYPSDRMGSSVSPFSVTSPRSDTSVPPLPSPPASPGSSISSIRQTPPLLRPIPLPPSQRRCTNPYCDNNPVNNQNPANHICDVCMTTYPQYIQFALDKFFQHTKFVLCEFGENFSTFPQQKIGHSEHLKFSKNLGITDFQPKFSTITQNIERVNHTFHLVGDGVEVGEEIEIRAHHEHAAQVLKITAADLMYISTALQSLGLALLPLEILSKKEDISEASNVERAKLITDWLSGTAFGTMGAVRLRYVGADIPLSFSLVGVCLTTAVAIKDFAFGIMDLIKYFEIRNTLIVLFSNMMENITKEIKNQIPFSNIPFYEIINDANVKYAILQNKQTRYMAPYLYFYAKYFGKTTDFIIKQSGNLVLPLVVTGVAACAIAFTAIGSLATGGYLLLGAGILSTLVSLIIVARKSTKFSRSQTKFYKLINDGDLRLTDAEHRTFKSCLPQLHRFAGYFINEPHKYYWKIERKETCVCRCHSIIFPSLNPIFGQSGFNTTDAQANCCSCHDNYVISNCELDGATLGDYMRFKLSQDITDVFLTMEGNLFFEGNFILEKGASLLECSMYQKFFLTRAVWEIIALDVEHRTAKTKQDQLVAIKNSRIPASKKRSDCTQIISSLIKRNF